MKYPGAELEAAEASNVPVLVSSVLFMVKNAQYYPQIARK